MNLSIIDADSLFYQSAKDSIEESIIVFKDKLDNMLKATSADYWCGFVTSGKCFRYNIDTNYKSNRTRPVPKFMKTLKEWAIAEYDLNVCTDVESDDMVVYWNNNPIHYYASGDEFMFCAKEINNPILTTDSVNKTICAIDKDILQSVPGKMFNYTYKLEDKTNPDSVVKGWWVETDAKSAERFKFIQLLMGDNTDSVGALRGIGVKTAEKMLDSVENYPEEVLGRYISHHRSVSKGIYEYSKNYRLLHMLENDDDFMREVGHLPEFPKINKVNKVVKEVIDF